MQYLFVPSRIIIEYGGLLYKFRYSVRIQENIVQIKLRIRTIKIKSWPAQWLETTKRASQNSLFNKFEIIPNEVQKSLVQM